MLAMILERLVRVNDNKVDVEELLEKAEIRFLELVGYEASHSLERLRHIMTIAELDCLSLAQIARCFAIRR